MTRPMGSTLFRDPQARSSALAVLGTLQPQTFGSLNRVDPLDLVSNYYLGECSVIRVGSIIILCPCKQCNSYTSAPVALFIMQSENAIGL